jgi:hypothetical protein
LGLCDWHGNGASAGLVIFSRDKVAEVAWKMRMLFVDTFTGFLLTDCIASIDVMMKWLLFDKL